MRIKRLDVLRCIAVILVLLHHSAILSVFDHMGYIGVDLFFVLSGFLISGLLYAEYQKAGTINFRRFFIRRGLKIYPAFYAMLLVTFIVQISAGKLSGWGPYAREIFFVQDYKPGIWLHCWSLGVEEHFYILLPIFLLLLIRFSLNSSNPFKIIPWAFLMVAVLCLLLRAATIWFTPPASFNGDTIMMPTHLRMDELFFGVLLGYFHYFHRQAVENFMRPAANRWIIGFFSLVFLCTSFVFSGIGHFYLIFGPTFLYLGFGGLLMLCIHVHEVLPQWSAAPLALLGSACAFVGLYSYSIYLWQGVFGFYSVRGFEKYFHVQQQGFLRFAWYFFGCIVFGILMSKLIEFPVLRLRDKFFPSPQSLSAGTPFSPEKALTTPITSPEVQLSEHFLPPLKPGHPRGPG